MRLVCKCFNVKLMTKSNDVMNAVQLNLLEAENSHAFFQEEVYEVAQGSLKESFQSLLQGEIIGSWNIQQCKTCKLITHAINCRSGLIVAGSSLLDANTLTWEDVPNYCQVFQILVPPSIAESNLDFVQTSFEGFEDEALIAASKKSKAFIDKATEEARTKVALYEAQQMQKLDTLKKQVDKELKMVTKLICDVKESERREALLLAAAKQEKEEMDQRQLEEENSVDEISGAIDNIDLELNPNIPDAQMNLLGGLDNEFQMRLNLTENQSYQMEPDHGTSAAGCGVFQMDDFDTIRQQDDDFPEDFDYEPSPCTAKKNESLDMSQVARSAPVAIPKFSMPTGIVNKDEQNRDGSGGEEEELDIGASIKKLARSVRLSTSDVFGDLPRPKLQRNL